MIFRLPQTATSEMSKGLVIFDDNGVAVASRHTRTGDAPPQKAVSPTHPGCMRRPTE